MPQRELPAVPALTFNHHTGMTAMAQIARTETNKVTNPAKNASDNVAELDKRTTDKAAEVTRELTGHAENVARSGFQSVRQATDAAAEVEQKTARRAGEGMAEINRSLVDLLTEQAQHNVQLFQALAQPANWRKGPQLQSEFLRTSFQRAAQFTWRYVEVGQAVMTSALPTARGQAKKA
jgi:hypothetical protein